MLARCQVPSILIILNPALTSDLSDPNRGNQGKELW